MTVDADILTLLHGAWANVWDGKVDADETDKVIDVALPFVLYYGKRTTPENVRAGGRAERGNFPAMTCVGATRDQADALASKIEAALDCAGMGQRTLRFFERSSPTRDDKYTRPGGDPLYNVGLRFVV